MAVQFGRVPHPAFLDRPITKPEGVGMDSLGKRSVKGVVLHRMIGTLWGTDSYFRMPSVGALTDYGVGTIGTDGAGSDGTIIRFNDPLGYQSGWASGRVSSPYGDGLAFINKYATNDPIGYGVVNRDQASIEISGKQYTDPVSDKAYDSVARLIAYWADQYQIPYDQFPIAPQDGFSFVRWHQEFTIGTGKVCPGSVVMDATDALFERVKTILKEYQYVADAPAPAPKPEVVTYAKPGPVPPLDGNDHVLGDVRWFACHRKVRVKAAKLKCLQYAMDGAKETREPLTQGEWVTVEWLLKAKNGKFYWVTERGTRLEMAGTTPRGQFII